MTRKPSRPGTEPPAPGADSPGVTPNVGQVEQQLAASMPLSGGVRDRLHAAFAPMAEFAKALKAADAEAETLLIAAGDESDIPTLAEHIERNPPSALAIAKLVWKAKSAAVAAGARTAATARHAATTATKTEAVAWYVANRKQWTKDEAAEEITKRYPPTKWRTARDWLKGA